VWPIKCWKTLKSHCSTQNRASLRLIDLFSSKNRTQDWAFSNRKTEWSAVDLRVFKKIISNQTFGVTNKLILSIRTSINRKESVMYLLRLRRSYQRKLSLTRIISARSHLLMLVRRFLMYSRRSRRLKHLINQLSKLNKSTKKHSLKGIKVIAKMMLGFNSI
jgi:hypothetical protein